VGPTSGREEGWGGVGPASGREGGRGGRGGDWGGRKRARTRSWRGPRHRNLRWKNLVRSEKIQKKADEEEAAMESARRFLRASLRLHRLAICFLLQLLAMMSVVP
jgi:hypothetical protein